MVFGNGDVDHLVRLEELRIERPGLERRAPNLHVLELPVIDKVHVRAQGGRGRRNTALDIAPSRVVHRPVKNPYLLCSRLEAELDHGRNHFGVGVARLLRRPVPADVRLNDHDIAPGNERAHAAQGVNRRLDDLPGRCAVGDNEVGPSRRFGGPRKHVQPPGHRESQRRSTRPVSENPFGPLFTSLSLLPAKRRCRRNRGRKI